MPNSPRDLRLYEFSKQFTFISLILYTPMELSISKMVCHIVSQYHNDDISYENTRIGQIKAN